MAYEKEMEAAIAAAFRAGKKILEVYGTEDFQVEFKSDDQPVSLADKLSNIELCSLLHTTFPTYGILTEEGVESTANQKLEDSLQKSYQTWKTCEFVWVIDPLDGTKDFIKRTGEFGVHIGLIKNGQPILGVNYYPATNVMYQAIKDEGAYKCFGNKSQRIFIRDVQNLKEMVIVASASSPDPKLQEFTREQQWNEPLKIGSLGLKLCLIAEGSADLYVLLNNKAKFWDVCSPQVILEEAGGRITDLNCKPLNYSSGKINFETGIIATNGKIHEPVVRLLQRYLKTSTV
jgi:3'(2'), 5'-bisphosphate nucleotidase